MTAREFHESDECPIGISRYDFAELYSDYVQEQRKVDLKDSLIEAFKEGFQAATDSVLGANKVVQKKGEQE